MVKVRPNLGVNQSSVTSVVFIIWTVIPPNWRVIVDSSHFINPNDI